MNGNISTPFDIKSGCRQGDPISGYLFIMVMEILALMLPKGKLKPYNTSTGLEHLLDIYTDDLTIYLEYNRKKSCKNRENVSKVLQILRKFQQWSGLKINLGKTYLAFFVKLCQKLMFLDELKLKWCTEFMLLGVYFDVTLSKMQTNYEKAVESHGSTDS